MPRVPFIGRLLFTEYVALVGSFILIGLEALIRIITLALPQPIIRFCYCQSRSLFNFLSSPQGKKSRTKKRTVVNAIRDASDFVDICALYGYYAEEHIVQTGDGYLLGLHRLGWKRGEEGLKVNSGPDSIRKRVVYLHHGILMNSEVWVCLTEAERCLPLQLVDRGYDVWLGNNRGNKYSKKSSLHSPTSIAFWNFSIDEFAFHDIPDGISYVLTTTSQPSLSYIGFSQGTAQAFAALSIHPLLNDRVDVFIALAPAMSPAGLSNGVVDALMKASPEVIFLAFGRRSILSSATMWQAILYPPIFVRIIDMALSFLFNWKSLNISPHQKLAAYPHLYSFTSTKSVVHWFQIIRTGKFQMYDDDINAILSIGAGTKYSKKHKFPTRNIKTPIVLVYGGSDSLVDIDVMLKELPKHTVAKEIPHYEHLDFLWGEEVDTLVFPHVFAALDTYADPERPDQQRSSTISFQPDGRLLAINGYTAANSGGSADESEGSRRHRYSGAGQAAMMGVLTTPHARRGAAEPSSSSPTPSPHTSHVTFAPASTPPSEASWLATPAGRATPARFSSPTDSGPVSDSALPSSRSNTAGRRRTRSGSTEGSSGGGAGGKPGFGAEGISVGAARAVGGVVDVGLGGMGGEKESKTSKNR